MHILITNDDGVTAPGLAALAKALRELGEVTVLAPDHNWSASGHVKTLHTPPLAPPFGSVDALLETAHVPLEFLPVERVPVFSASSDACHTCTGAGAPAQVPV